MSDEAKLPLPDLENGEAPPLMTPGASAARPMRDARRAAPPISKRCSTCR